MKNYIPNYHIIKVSYLGATNANPSRVRMYSERFKQGVTISYNHEFDNTMEVAADHLAKLGFDIIGKAEGKDCYYAISTTFKPFKED